jgi:oxidoreductase
MNPSETHQPIGQSALLIGATGETGKYLLKELLQSTHFTRVGEYGRRVTDEKDIATGKEKLEQKVVDFEKLERGAWKDSKWDVVFITLGPK